MSQPIRAALLDTDILSAVMRQHPVALARARAYLGVHHRLTFSMLTRYEILRGLYAKHATAQLVAFDRLCSVSTILPLTDAIVVRAATIYAELHQRGTLIGDADILIAPTGLEHGLVVVTNNASHYQRIAGIQLDNWLA
ncbi:MAG TPA: type II toxin-antitoxin system VapC family toxin [Gemmatimonadaceae bacterium]|nr:type II toxin-antitoxin system VapC family toxin [Gemmatimonadaceae bacterium]